MQLFNPIVKVIERLVFELTYSEVTVQNFTDYAYTFPLNGYQD